MYLTVELLRKYGAREEKIQEFIGRFPNGVEALDFLEEIGPEAIAGNYSPWLEALYWGYRMLPWTTKEKEKYCEVLNIDSSSSVYESYDVEESEKVIHSDHIYLSGNIDNCSNIRNSNYVASSATVEGSDGVLKSEYIVNSSLVDTGMDIQSSKEIYKASHVKKSQKCARVDSIENCVGIFSSSGCEEVYYSSFLKNCHHCLFCDDIEDASFRIFNQPVSEKDFFIILSMVESYFDNKLEPLIETTINDEFYFGLDWHVSTHFTKIYRSLSQEVFNQLYRLPGYNDWLMYQITLNTRSFRDLKNS